jgi:hypothetical protein
MKVLHVTQISREVPTATRHLNDYLTERGRTRLTPVYHALGLTTGLVVHGMSPAERKKSLVDKGIADQTSLDEPQSKVRGQTARPAGADRPADHHPHC